MNHTFHLDMTERVSRVETEQDNMKEVVQKHEALLDAMNGKLTKLVSEVGQIRNALYVMAAAIAANIPAIADLFNSIKLLLK